MSDAIFTEREMRDFAHRMKCLVERGSRRCICADYAAITGCLHPDCPQHGYIIGEKAVSDV